MFSGSSRFSLLSFILLLSLTPAIQAQQTSEKNIVPAQPVAGPAKAGSRSKDAVAAEKAKADQQKALALSLLVSLSNEARSFPDQKLRARTLSRIADALWDPDPDQGRALFRRAWDAAAVADQESARRVEEERKRQESATGSFALAMPPDLRSEVLRLAAKRDRALGEELLEKLTEARKQDATEATSPTRADSLDTPAALRQRLRLARQLLDSDVERALQFADPALGTVSMDALSFLTLLRDKNPEAADQRYARMLVTAESDLQADANTVSLLASYLFTPHLYVTFSPDGGQNASQMNQRTAPPQVALALRTAFFNTAARILLRPSPSREQDRSSSGLQGKFLVIRRLMPLFEQHAPKPTVEQLRAELTALGQGTDRDIREDEDEDSVLRGIGPEREATDVEKSLLDKIDRAKTAAERDALYLQLATRTAQKGEMRARDFADKIEDSELRKQTKPYVDMTLAMNAVEKKDFAKALTLASTGELSQIQRVWLLSQTAKLLPAAEREKALEVIGDAAVEAKRIGGSDPDRARAFVAVANAYLATERARAWETMLDVVKAANSAEGFNGEDGRLTMRIQTKFMTSMRTNSIDDFNLPGVFRALALENSTQAIEIARSFEAEAPRATALIAVARALLSDKPIDRAR
jgi:hypothetical protein